MTMTLFARRSLIFAAAVVSLLFVVHLRSARAHHSFATSTPKVTATATVTAVQQIAKNKTLAELYRETICENQRSCHLIGNVSDAERTLEVRNCMCDAECNTYGDCCFDSPFYNERNQKSNFKLFHCPQEKWYLKASCAAEYTDHEIVSRCADGVKRASSDVRIITPVTDVERNVSYANVYCAMCDHRDPRLASLRPWNVTFRCEVNATTNSASADGGVGVGAGDQLEASAVARNLNWDDALNEYRAHYRGRAYRCEPLRQPPAGIGAGLRRCVAVVAACPAAAAAADSQLAANCDSFSLFVHDDVLSYRNTFCAQCNNVTRLLNGCKSQIEDRFSTPQRIFSGANKANGNAACSDPNVNPDLKKKFCQS